MICLLNDHQIEFYIYGIDRNRGGGHPNIIYSPDAEVWALKWIFSPETDYSLRQFGTPGLSLEYLLSKWERTNTRAGALGTLLNKLYRYKYNSNSFTRIGNIWIALVRFVWQLSSIVFWSRWQTNIFLYFLSPFTTPRVLLTLAEEHQYREENYLPVLQSPFCLNSQRSQTLHQVSLNNDTESNSSIKIITLQSPSLHMSARCHPWFLFSYELAVGDGAEGRLELRSGVASTALPKDSIPEHEQIVSTELTTCRNLSFVAVFLALVSGFWRWQ